MRAISLKLLATGAFVLATALPAMALSITPATVPQWSGNQADEPSILAHLNTLGLGVDFLTDLAYKSDDETDRGLGFVDSGPFEASYDTVFVPAGDAGSATISHVLGSAFIAGSPIYLLVKDGGMEPSWYLFDLTALLWNGTETLELTGFWPGSGAISHVSIYEGSASVPDGGSAAALLGSALLGLGLLRRRFGRG